MSVCGECVCVCVCVCEITGAVSGLNTLLMKHELRSNSGLEGETPEIACMRHTCVVPAAALHAHESRNT